MSAKDVARYLAASHAMQSGVLAEQQLGSTDGSPKHLRVGVNSGAVCLAALTGLLIAKGVITLDEYERANADEMEIEQKRYEERLGVKLA